MFNPLESVSVLVLYLFIERVRVLFCFLMSSFSIFRQKKTHKNSEKFRKINVNPQPYDSSNLFISLKKQTKNPDSKWT